MEMKQEEFLKHKGSLYLMNYQHIRSFLFW